MIYFSLGRSLGFCPCDLFLEDGMGGLKAGDDVVVLWFWFSGGGFGFS